VKHKITLQSNINLIHESRMGKPTLIPAW